MVKYHKNNNTFIVDLTLPITEGGSGAAMFDGTLNHNVFPPMVTGRLRSKYREWNADACRGVRPLFQKKGPDPFYEGSVAVRETGLMCANMLRAFHVGKASTSDGEPSSRMRSSRLAWPQVRWPACHLTNASASAVM